MFPFFSLFLRVLVCSILPCHTEMSHLTSRHLHSPTDTILDSPLAPLAMHRPDRPFHQYQQRRQASRQPDRILLISGLLGFFGIWFLTPLSVHVTDAVLLFVPVESDFEMGREAWRSMKHKYPPVSDLWGVEKIGKDLVTVLDQDGQRMSWSFAVVHAPMVNAFVLPGGIVRVTDTLLKSLHLSDAELAALIGHEMGHVLHRHSQARLLQQQLISYLWKMTTRNHLERRWESSWSVVLDSWVNSHFHGGMNTKQMRLHGNSLWSHVHIPQRLSDRCFKSCGNTKVGQEKHHGRAHILEPRIALAHWKTNGTICQPLSDENCCDIPSPELL